MKSYEVIRKENREFKKMLKLSIQERLKLLEDIRDTHNEVAKEYEPKLDHMHNENIKLKEENKKLDEQLKVARYNYDSLKVVTDDIIYMLKDKIKTLTI